MTAEIEYCVWENDDGDYCWHASCSFDFCQAEDSSDPVEWMRYCCHCGKPVEFWMEGKRVK